LLNKIVKNRVYKQVSSKRITTPKTTKFMNEKERKKQLIKEFKHKQKEEFEQSLPMERILFEKLFDYLDNKLEENDCDDTNKLATQFLKKNKIENIQTVLSWLSENGGYCDCEILANVEEKFE
jgi:hypothetical protein